MYASSTNVAPLSSFLFSSLSLSLRLYYRYGFILSLRGFNTVISFRLFHLEGEKALHKEGGVQGIINNSTKPFLLFFGLYMFPLNVSAAVCIRKRSMQLAMAGIFNKAINNLGFLSRSCTQAATSSDVQAPVKRHMVVY